MDRRIEVLIRAATEDLQPLVKSMQLNGWPVEVVVDASPDLLEYKINVVVTIIPVVVER